VPKKQRSAKQKAATRKLIAFNKAKSHIKKSVRKLKKAARKTTTRRKSNPGNKKSVAGKKGIAGMTRFKKFLLGLGVGAGVSTVAGLTRVREVEFLGPIIDASVGGGIEGQVGVAIPKIIRLVASRAGFGTNGNGGNGIMIEGA